MDSESPLPNGSEREQRAEALGGDGPAVAASTSAAGVEREDDQWADDMEVEMMEQDHFDFLDRATELGCLQSELDEVRTSLARKKTNGKYIPLKLYRSAKSNSISVTDVQTGLWCEVQLEYRYLHPHMKVTKEWSKLEEKGRAVQLKTPEMKQGTTLHLAKELEVHKIEKVETKTYEDTWAVTLINTYSQLATVAAGGMEREICVFGDLFDQGILVKGIIDQVQLTKDSNGELTILDYKTRRSNSMPSEAQKRGHALQLMLYKCMLDGLTCGMTKINLLAKHLKLNFSRELTEDVLRYLDKNGLLELFTKTKPGKTEDSSDIETSFKGLRVTFGELAGKLSELIVRLNLPLVTSMMVQYVYQETRQDIGLEVIVHDEEWTKRTFINSLNFWLGKREPRGVDLEDMWKCETCQFKDVCVWRRQRELEQSPAASKPHHIY